MCSKFISFIFCDFAVGVPVRLSRLLSWKPSSSSWCEAGGQAAAGGMPETECTAEVVDIIVIIAIITITKLTIGYLWPTKNSFNLSLAVFDPFEPCFIVCPCGWHFCRVKAADFPHTVFWEKWFLRLKKISRDIFSGFNSTSQNFAPQDPTLVMIWSLWLC